MNTTGRGNVGEDLAAEYLQREGFDVFERNWKTPVCEIDIVAKRQKRIYFVEVKARSSGRFGSGFEYITAKKLKQMQFAAEMWVHAHKWTGEYQLAAISVDAGEVSFLEEL